MEARSYAKINQQKSDQIAKDIEAFEARGGKIEVLPTRSANAAISSYTLNDPFNNRAKAKARKKLAKKAVDTAATEIDSELDDDDVEINPSRETPAEQLDIEVE